MRSSGVTINAGGTGMQEFEKLKKRYFKAQKYYRERYPTDTPERQAAADKAALELKKQLDEAWERVKRKEIDISQVDEIPKLKLDYWQAKEVRYYAKSRKATIRLELPQFWKYVNVIEG